MVSVAHLLASVCLALTLLWGRAASADIVIPPEDPPSPEPAEPPPKAGCDARTGQSANLLVIGGIAVLALATLRSARSARNSCTPDTKAR